MKRRCFRKCSMNIYIYISNFEKSNRVNLKIQRCFKYRASYGKS